MPRNESSGEPTAPEGGRSLETGVRDEPAGRTPTPSDIFAVRDALQWGYRDALREHGELLESLGISLREAAYRGDDVTARAHVMQARAVLLDAIEATKGLGRVSGGAKTLAEWRK